MNFKQSKTLYRFRQWRLLLQYPVNFKQSKTNEQLLFETDVLQYPVNFKQSKTFRININEITGYSTL